MVSYLVLVLEAFAALVAAGGRTAYDIGESVVGALPLARFAELIASTGVDDPDNVVVEALGDRLVLDDREAFEAGFCDASNDRAQYLRTRLRAAWAEALEALGRDGYHAGAAAAGDLDPVDRRALCAGDDLPDGRTRLEVEVEAQAAALDGIDSSASPALGGYLVAERLGEALRRVDGWYGVAWSDDKYAVAGLLDARVADLGYAGDFVDVVAELVDGVDRYVRDRLGEAFEEGFCEGFAEETTCRREAAFDPVLAYCDCAACEPCDAGACTDEACEYCAR